MSTAFTSKIAKAGFGLVAGIAMFAGVSALALTSADVQMLLNAGIINSTQAAALMSSVSGSTTTTTTGLGSCYQFTTQLSVGSTGEAVRQLQMVLNSNPATALAVAAGANGSAGNESTYFGSATEAAVMKYQAWKGIAQVGQVGPQTRAALNASCTTTTTTTTTTGTTTTGTTTTGAVSVGLSTDNPSSNTIVTGQATADLAHFTFTGSGTVTALTLQRTGISTNSTLQSVYLYQGATRLTDSASVNTNGVITFNGLNLAVNGSTEVAVKADIIPDSNNGLTTASGQTVGVTLTGYTVNGTAMTANVSGNIQSVSSGYGVLATVNLAQGLASTVSGSTQSYNNTTSASVNAGTTGYSVFSMPVQVGTRSVLLKGLTLRYIGSAANGSLANIKLYVDGVQVGTASTVNSNGYIVFDLSGAPYTLTTGGHTVEVRADIAGGSARTFYLSLQNAADFMVTDSQLNVNVAPSTNGSIFSISQAGTISVNAGSATFQQDPAFTTTTNITGGASNTVIGQFALTGYGEDVKVMSLPVTVFIANTTPAAAGINNVALYFNGAQVGSSISLTSGTSCTVNGLTGTCYANTFQLGSQLIIPAGSNDTLQVRADLQDSGNVSYSAGSIAVQIGTGTGQGVTSLQAVTIPGATITGNTLTIQTGQLVVSKNAGYTNQTFSPNTAGVKIGSFTIQNQSSSEAIRVTNLQVGLTSDSAGMTALTSGSTPALTNFSNLKIVDESGLITGLNPVGSVSGTNNFSTSYTIGAGQSQTVDVYADIGGASTGTAYTTLTVQAIGASSNVTLTPALTVGQAVMLGTGSVSAPSIVSSATTSAQYVATASNATNATKIETQFTATNGTGMISELKYAVVGSTPGTVSTITVGTSTASVVTPATTTLNAAITSTSATTVGVTASGLPVGTILTVGSEQMLVTASNGTSYTVTRGVNGTTAATASNGATVTPSGLAYLTGLAISVPNGTSGAYVDAYQTYSPVNGTTGSLMSGSTSQVSLTYVKSTIGSTTTSGAVTPAPGNTVMLVGSEPTVTVNTAQQTGLIVGGQNQIGQVTIAANAAGTIGVNQIQFSIGNSGFSSGFSVSSVTPIISDSGAAVAATGATCANTTSSLITCTFSGTNGYIITAGTSKTFSLYATVTGTTAASSTVSVSSQLVPATFNWTDIAGGGTAGARHGTEVIGGVTGGIYGFPTNSYSIRQ